MTARRDEAIDRLLHESRSTGTPPGECPDAETLAAFAAGTLRTAARRDVEAHIADCHRCQMVAASMVNVESTLGLWPDEVPAKASWWRRNATGWMIPAAVGVTAGALWLAVVDQRRPSVEPLPDSQSTPANEVAVTRPQSGRVEGLQDSVGNARAGSISGLRTEPPATAAPPAAQGAAAATAEESQGRFAQARPGAPAAETVPVTQDSRQGPPAAAASEPPSASAAPPLQDSAESRELARSSEADRLSAPAELAKPAPASPPAGVAAARGITAQRRDASSFDVVSPDRQVRWRISAGAVVQRSNDGGASWLTQQLGASGEWTAGAAPAPDTCWLVGRGGIVIRTTNAGRSWERVKFPMPVDLTAVTAASAQDATVGLVDGRRFRTTDGGAAWTAVP